MTVYPLWLGDLSFSLSQSSKLVFTCFWLHICFCVCILYFYFYVCIDTYFSYIHICIYVCVCKYIYSEIKKFSGIKFVQDLRFRLKSMLLLLGISTWYLNDRVTKQLLTFLQYTAKACLLRKQVSLTWWLIFCSLFVNFSNFTLILNCFNSYKINFHICSSSRRWWQFLFFYIFFCKLQLVSLCVYTDTFAGLLIKIWSHLWLFWGRQMTSGCHFSSCKLLTCKSSCF